MSRLIVLLLGLTAANKKKRPAFYYKYAVLSYAQQVVVCKLSVIIPCSLLSRL
jgi:hypothetical protein